MSLRDELKEYLDHYLIEEFMIGYQKKCMDYDILRMIEKRIDIVKQRSIEYVTCKDEGDPRATEALADIRNDYATENYWIGVKDTITRLKEEILKK